MRIWMWMQKKLRINWRPLIIIMIRNAISFLTFLTHLLLSYTDITNPFSWNPMCPWVPNKDISVFPWSSWPTSMLQLQTCIPPHTHPCAYAHTHSHIHVLHPPFCAESVPELSYLSAPSEGNITGNTMTLSHWSRRGNHLPHTDLR